MEILKKIGTFFLDTFQTILITASIVMVLYAFVIQPNQVSGSSMYPTFKDKEFLLSNLIDVRMDKYKRGDVVVFHSPTEDDKLFIKRVIGVPGDQVEVREGSVYLNGELLDESVYLASDVVTSGGAFMLEGVGRMVPEGTIFVMGDNRPYSSDSREWGFLDKSKVVGRSMVRVFPFSLFHIIHNPYTEGKI